MLSLTHGRCLCSSLSWLSFNRWACTWGSDKSFRGRWQCLYYSKRISGFISSMMGTCLGYPLGAPFSPAPAFEANKIVSHPLTLTAEIMLECYPPIPSPLLSRDTRLCHPHSHRILKVHSLHFTRTVHIQKAKLFPQQTFKEHLYQELINRCLSIKMLLNCGLREDS